MSLGIVFKGPEGVVLAADSRVTLTAQLRSQAADKLILPATYDNATKLLKVAGHNYVGAVTYGEGAIGQREPRTAHSFIPEFESLLAKKAANNPDEKPASIQAPVESGKASGIRRLKVAEFAKELSDFYLARWKETMPSGHTGPGIVFLIAGFDPDEPYGRVFEINIPGHPEPKEWHNGTFGAVWGGQREFTDRLIHGFDPRIGDLIRSKLAAPDQWASVEAELKQNLSVSIPYQFLPLQDCVDLSIFLIRTTMNIQKWQVGIRGVGGAIDVATITRTEGFQAVQQKAIIGESCR